MGDLTVQFFDREGKVTGALKTTGPTERLVENSSKIPATLDWYRDATKWLITLAAGAAVLGLGFFDRTAADSLQMLFFGASGTALLIAILAGILCHLWIISYANEWEFIHSSAGDERPPPVKRKDESPPPVKSKLETRLSRIGVFYHVLLWSFFVGMILFAALGFSKVWQRGQDEEQGRFMVAPLGASGGDKALLLDTKNGDLWFIQEAHGDLRFQKLTKDEMGRR